jgi:hypothetical protein
MTKEQGKSNREYEVALSFAGEDREYVEAVASFLRQKGVSVFYDRYEEVTLWGKNLYDHLQHVYAEAAEYTVIFVSGAYAGKLWTNHERQSAQSRAFGESREYILPARFDDTEVPGLLKTTGYIDLRKKTPEELASLIVKKLRPSGNVAGKDNSTSLKRNPLLAPALAALESEGSASTVPTCILGEANMDKSDELLRALRRYQALSGQHVPLARAEEMATNLGIEPHDAPTMIDRLAERNAVALHWGAVEVKPEQAPGGGATNVISGGVFLAPVQQVGRDLHIGTHQEAVPALAAAIAVLRAAMPVLPREASDALAGAERSVSAARDRQLPETERKTLIKQAVEGVKTALGYVPQLTAVAHLADEVAKWVG